MLTGENASLRQMNTLVVIENIGTAEQKIWIRGKGALRIFWLIGGWWRLLGVLSYLPFGTDIIYRLIARHRHKLSGELPLFTVEEKARFLP